MPGAGAPVVISPFANERVRQWPAAHFRELVELIWREHGLRSVIVGNACGALSWGELVAAVDAAPYVVANNSGVAHLAASRRRWTLCVFAASHSPAEWAPRGPFVVTVFRKPPCAPCAIGADLCPNGVACMTDLKPGDAFWRFDEARRRVLSEEPGELPEQAAA